MRAKRAPRNVSPTPDRGRRRRVRFVRRSARQRNEARAYEHGNDFVFNSAVEPDSLIAVFGTILTRVSGPSPRASLGRRTVCGRTEQLSAAGSEALRN